MDFHNYSLDQHEAQQAADYRHLQSLDTDTCWDDFGFREFWDDVESLLNERPELPVDPESGWALEEILAAYKACLLYTSPSPRDLSTSRMPSSA